MIVSKIPNAKYRYTLRKNWDTSGSAEEVQFPTYKKLIQGLVDLEKAETRGFALIYQSDGGNSCVHWHWIATINFTKDEISVKPPFLAMVDGIDKDLKIALIKAKQEKSIFKFLKKPLYIPNQHQVEKFVNKVAKWFDKRFGE